MNDKRSKRMHVQKVSFQDTHHQRENVSTNITHNRLVLQRIMINARVVEIMSTFHSAISTQSAPSKNILISALQERALLIPRVPLVSTTLHTGQVLLNADADGNIERRYSTSEWKYDNKCLHKDI